MRKLFIGLFIAVIVGALLLITRSILTKKLSSPTVQEGTQVQKQAVMTSPSDEQKNLEDKATNSPDITETSLIEFTKRLDRLEAKSSSAVGATGPQGPKGDTGATGATGSAGSSITMSDEEKRYWSDQAALLDPAAYEFVSGTGWSRTVPSGQTWYAVSQYQTHSGGQQQIHQRLGDVDQAVMLPAGTTISPGQNSYIYICEPSRVTGTDSRYTNDPKGLYYTRLDRLRSLSINYLYIAVPGSLATAATVTADFPTDFTKGLIVEVSAYEISWGGMQYMENGIAKGAVNLQNEINNNHSVRFGQGVKYPFDRTVMPGIMAAAGNHDGTAAATSVGGGFIIEYIKLPSDW